MIYILIMLFTSGHGLSTFTQEFNSLEACQAAGKLFTEQKGVRNKIEASVCAAKGETK